jgi:RNA polymerase sigma factor (sigma-70 family)
VKVKKEFIDGCLKGEYASQKELYDALLPYLNALCGRYLNDTSLRQDILQESFVVIFKKIEQFDPQKGAFHSWASRIVINNCLKQNKSAMRFVQLQLDKHEESVDPEVVSQLSNEELIRFLKTMPQKYYEVFNLFALEDFSHEEVGEILGIKVSLSRKRLARARAWLKAKPKSLDSLLVHYKYKTG